MSSDFQQSAQELIDAGRFLFDRGWVPATSGNFSVRLPDGRIAVTVSDCHKGRLSIDDIMLTDAIGNSLDDNKPSAEILLHVHLYSRFPEVNAVLHPHTVNATLLSRMVGEALVLQDYELLKAFGGVDTHDDTIRVPILENDQDIARLAEKVEARFHKYAPVYGYMIAGHGFYTWGESMDDALRHVEAFEFLFECEMRLRGVNNR